MNIELIIGVIFFVILISIQYTLNKILYELKNIKKVLLVSKKNNDKFNGWDNERSYIRSKRNI